MTTFPITFFLFLFHPSRSSPLSLSIQFIHLSPVNKVGKGEGKTEEGRAGGENLSAIRESCCQDEIT